ncbi:TPA: hypothetical protein U1C79_000082 [Streptococcus suis]|nr:hypothetical protein [Streptococcus suis]HEM3674873.1 hypothetical protein [Streptococcus suis]
MKKIKEWGGSFYTNPYPITLFLLALLLFVLQWSYPVIMDDKWWLDKPFSLDFMVERYQIWSNRLFIESFALVFSHLPKLFRLFNSLVFVGLLDIILANSLGRKVKYLFLLLGLFALLPISMFLIPGLMLTNLNYLWPVTAGLASFLLYRSNEERKANKPYIYMVINILLLFATNHEQVAVVFLAIWGYEWWRQKGLSPFGWILFILTGCNLVFALLSPGISVRAIEQANKYFPEFFKLTVLDKVLLGLSHVGKTLLYNINHLFVVFLLLLVLNLFLTPLAKKQLFPFLLFVPFMALLSLGQLFMKVGNSLGILQDLFAYPKFYVGKVKTLPGWLTQEVSALFVVAIICLLCLIAYALYLVFRRLDLVYFWFVAVASLAMVGFSGTIFTSGDRISFILALYLIYLSCLLVSRMMDMKRKHLDIQKGNP